MSTVLITGIHRGIGKALAQKFLAEGWRVLGATRDGMSDIAHENLSVLALDLAKPDTIASCAAALKERGEKPDALVNNAGVYIDKEDADNEVLKTDELRRTLEVNLVGTAAFTEAVLPLLPDGAHVVNISSRMGSIEQADSGSPSYRISKAALNMYTKTLAARLEPRGIVVSSAHPGWVRTDMGGSQAPVPPQEAAADIYALAVSRPPTGGFWHKGARLPW